MLLLHSYFKSSFVEVEFYFSRKLYIIHIVSVAVCVMDNTNL
jgi:hypothetical protein